MIAEYAVRTDTGRIIPVNITEFPSGEVNVKLEISPGSKFQVKETVTVFVSGYDANTLFILACIKNALDDLFLRSDVKAKVYLFMPYTPHARYDRHMVEGDSFALQVFADMLNLLKFDRVLVADPHSSTTTALIKNCVEIPQHVIMLDMLNMFEPRFDFLVAPDEGSAKKIFKLAQALNKPVVTMSKTRNPVDGKITGVKITGAGFLDGNPEDYHGLCRCLIVDDICDGGRTFIEAAKVLRGAGAESVSLAVTHGIFSQGTLNLLDNGIDSIYCTDSFGQLDNRDVTDAVHVFKYF